MYSETRSRLSLMLPVRNLLSLTKPALLLTSLLCLYLLYNHILTPPPPNLSVLWYTKLGDNYLGALGFIQEALNFIIPLSGMMEFGWFAASSLADVKTNQFFVNLSETDQVVLLDLYVKGARIDEEFPVNNNVISVVFDQPSQYPNIFETTRLKYSVYKVGRAMFETNWIPTNWEYYINEYLDELWVPSNFAKGVFQSAGVFKPIYVIKEGFDSKPFHQTLSFEEKKASRQHFYPQCLETDVIFLAVGKMERRKGVDILVNTFKNTFNYPETGKGACLYIRAEMTTKQKDVIKMLNDRGIRVYTLNRLSNEDLILAYQSADVFALPTHGEGWGRPIMEAMAAGLPVIVPIWSGVSEFVNEAYALPLHVKQLELAFRGESWAIGGRRYQNLHRWASINSTELENLLLWCVDNPDMLQEIGRMARLVMFKHYTREIIAQDVKTRILEIQNEIRQQGLETYLDRNRKKVLTKDFESLRHRNQATLNQMNVNNDKLENRLKSLVNSVDDVNERLDKVSQMMSNLNELLMEKSILTREDEKVPGLEKESNNRATAADKLFNN